MESSDVCLVDSSSKFRFFDPNNSRYSEEADGVIVAFQNIKLLNSKSKIVDESPFIRINVKADCLVFKPQRNMEISGTVNMVGLHNIGLIVCGLFNSSIPED